MPPPSGQLLDGAIVQLVAVISITISKIVLGENLQVQTLITVGMLRLCYMRRATTRAVFGPDYDPTFRPIYDRTLDQEQGYGLI